MTSFFRYAFSVSSSSTPISTSRKYPKISRRPCTGMRNRGGFHISSPINRPRCAVESTTMTTSIPASTRTVNFWIFVSTVSNTIFAVPGAPALSPVSSMTRSVILKLPTGCHGHQGTCAAQDLLQQRILLQRVRIDVLHVLVRCQNVIAELLHVIHFIAQQLIGISIRIGCHCYICESEVLDRLVPETGYEVIRHRVAILNVADERTAPFPDYSHGFDAGLQEIFRECGVCRLARRGSCGWRACGGSRQR